ncbi:carboxypeptidase M32 [Radiobacillus kanasensis]|nr:carboxypeptidase M32 [Radiobacillus kanasensis]UFU01262.1 carboxypeptidase M32 [Radiobacillus kanasensis]
MEIKEKEQQFKDLLKEQKAYEESLYLMMWDLRTKAPKKGMDLRSEVIGFLSQKLHALSTSDQMKQFINDLKGKTEDPILAKSIEECEKEYNRNKKIPEAEYKEYVTLQSRAESVWTEARVKGDFSLLQPYLEKLVDYKRKFAEYWGYEKNIYDALLDMYEPGVTTETLDQVFPALRKELTSLVEKVNQSNHKPNPEVLQHHFPKEKQEDFSLEILKRMGFDFEAGRLDETVHPFAIGINPNDVRVTTRYDEDDFRMAVFGTIHEGGHALYEQNIDPSLYQTPLAGGTSMGIHESQSLFWENLVARSEGFWQNHFEVFKSFAPNEFKSLSFDEFYKAINEVKPSFIRIEADEMTYALHIMIRYELEKALISGEIEVKDLPELWNDKMEEYLGIRPTSDKEGVLQDIHWSGGDFGYFPSYALGYMYAAQIYHTMKKEIDVDELIESGNFLKIKEWLGENIHRHGKMKQPLEILKDVTDEGLNPKYLVDYLTEKYSKIYQL